MVGGLVHGNLKGAWKNLKRTGSSVVKAVDVVAKTAGSVMNKMLPGSGRFIGNIVNIGKSVVNGVKSLGNAVVGLAKGNIKGFWKNVKKTTNSAVQIADDSAPVKGLGKIGASMIKNTVTGKIGKAFNGIQEAQDAVMGEVLKTPGGKVFGKIMSSKAGLAIGKAMNSKTAKKILKAISIASMVVPVIGAAGAVAGAATSAIGALSSVAQGTGMLGKAATTVSNVIGRVGQVASSIQKGVDGFMNGSKAASNVLKASEAAGKVNDVADKAMKVQNALKGKLGKNS